MGLNIGLLGILVGLESLIWFAFRRNSESSRTRLLYGVPQDKARRQLLSKMQSCIIDHGVMPVCCSS
jgi:hypothetical protein